MSTVLLHDAIATLTQGGLVAFPTETVYGLGADARNDRAVAEIFARKGRPQFNPLIVHFPTVEMAKAEVAWNTKAERLAAAFWPGPLTLVLPRAAQSRISLLVSAGLPTLAVRVPAHPLAHELLLRAHMPVAAPSANRSGRVSPTLASHVQEEFGDAVPVLDGGACTVGLESTVVGFEKGGAVILRPGSITLVMIERVLNTPVGYIKEGADISAPGMLLSHYAPSIPVRMNASEAKTGEALLGFGAVNGATLNLSERGDMVEAAANLFAFLRGLDDGKYSGIAVSPIANEGLGIAINDRLKRASMR